MSLSVMAPKGQMTTNFGSRVEKSKRKEGVNTDKGNLEFNVSEQDYWHSEGIEGSIEGFVLAIHYHNSHYPDASGPSYDIIYNLKSGALFIEDRGGIRYKTQKKVMIDMLQYALKMNLESTPSTNVEKVRKANNARAIRIILEKLKKDPAHIS